MSFWGYVERGSELQKRLAAALRSDQTALQNIIAQFVPPSFASCLVEKILEVGDYTEEDTLHSVPSLVDLCAKRVGSDKSVVDTLFAIYGPDTNFPFPSCVVSKVYSLRSGLDDFESPCKLALLMSNNASTLVSLSSFDEGDTTDAANMLGRLAWKKLSTVSKKLQHIHAEFIHEGPEFCQMETVLPAIRQLIDLRELQLTGTTFLDEDLQVVGASLQQLRSFTFRIDGQVTEVGVQALGQLKKLEELIFSYDPEVCNGPYEDLADARDILIARCLGTLPWLKLVCAHVELEFFYEHVVPLMVEKVPLALEQFQFIDYLKINKACCTDLNKQAPLLHNVRFLRIFHLENNEKMIRRLEEVEMNRVEQLFVLGASPAYAIFNFLATNLSVLEMRECSGAWNFLKILDICPMLENVSIECYSRDSGHYSFHQYYQLQHIPQNLKDLRLDLNNKRGLKLPHGVLVKLLAAPKLESVRMMQLPWLVDDCLEVALNLKSGSLRMDNLTDVHYQDYRNSSREANEAISTLLAAFCAFCPKLYQISLTDTPRELISILSALFYKKICIS